MPYIDYKESRKIKFYENWPEDKEPITLDENTQLYKYNRPLWEKLSLQRVERERKIKAVMKKYNSSLEWWPCRRSDLPKPSSAEQLIIDELVLWDIVWHREVEFKALMSSDHSYHRYDFLLELPKTIHLIEYDGKWAHSNPDQIEKDRIKNEFCRANNIPLIRYSSQHYYKLGLHIGDLLTTYGIKKKGLI